MTPRMTAVIVNFNAGAELAACLESLAEAMHDRPWEAVVVDNASTDGSEAVTARFEPQARLLRNPANIGFGRAVNQGLAIARAPLLLVINPDCRLGTGALEPLEAALDAHPTCAIVGPKILDPDGTVQGSARGDPDMLTGLFGRTSAMRRLLPGLGVSRRNVVNPEHEPGTRNQEPGTVDALRVDWVSGACMLTRTDMLRSVGGFDERYFLYWEDADLCRRLRNRGYETRYVPDAVAIHRVGQSSRTARRLSIRAFHDSAYLYYATHVAPAPLSPRRLVARALLAARRAWHLRSARS
jgi:N-acetylglucosaminyl-diphospho-decaprenol L-rhamnosyltransferase